MADPAGDNKYSNYHYDPSTQTLDPPGRRVFYMTKYEAIKYKLEGYDSSKLFIKYIAVMVTILFLMCLLK